MDTLKINQLPLFSSLPHDLVNEFTRDLKRHALPSQTLIFREGQPGSCFYIILEGQVEVIKALGTPDERFIALRGPGEFVGEMSLLETDGLRSASVRARTPVTMLEITTADFESLLQQWPSLAFHMLRALSLRLRATDDATIRDLQVKNQELARAYQELQAAQAQIIEKQNLERELQVARRIQASILPRTLPAPDGFDFGVRMEPARAVGGDFFDFITFDPDRIGVFIGDVSDKGVPAAIFMALTRSLLRAMASPSLAPKKVLLRVNRHLLDMNDEGMFATVLYGVLDRKTASFAYARAGHEVPFAYTQQGDLRTPERGQGQPLGIFDRPQIDEQSLAIPPSGLLMLYTDGVVDAMDSRDAFYSLRRFQEFLGANLHLPAQDMCDRVVAELDQFRGTKLQTDDFTLVAIHSQAV